VVLVGALDTKYAEYDFIRVRLAQHGVPSWLVDIGVLNPPRMEADVDRSTVARAVGADVAELAAAADRNAAMVAMAGGASAIVQRWYRGGEVSGVLVLGGSNAGYLMSRLAAALPIGCPKLLVSTIVAGDTRPYLQASDLIMMYPVVDLAGLNSISEPILARAADALAGIVTGPELPARAADKVSIGCTMFGVTTPCVTGVQDRLAPQGWELDVFHANGTGGRTLERMITERKFAAVADITTTELADELVGGVCSAGADRLTAATAAGVPQVVSVGALDMVSFGPRHTVPETFVDRRLYEHNPAVTLMRTSPEECAQLGVIIAEKLNPATAFTEVHIPMRGFSQISTPGRPFHDPVADEALIDALRSALIPGIPLHLHDVAINDPEFAGHIAQALIRSLDSQKGTTCRHDPSW
jgi:uncharacterized protein (UPF0261 family)